MLVRQTYYHQELTVGPRGSHLCHMEEITSKAEIRSWLKCMVSLLTARRCCRQCSLVASSAVNCMASNREAEYTGRRTAIQTSQWHTWAFRAMEQKRSDRLAWNEQRGNWSNAGTTASTIISKTIYSESRSSTVSKRLSITPTIGTTCIRARPTTILMECILSGVLVATMFLQILEEVI